MICVLHRNLMGKHKDRKKQLRRLVKPKQSSRQQPFSISPQEHKPIWKKGPRSLWAILSVGAILVGLFVLYPSLSINEDYSFDAFFPYNSSFSIINEGYWPIADLSATCSANFTMRPWTTDPSDKSGMNLHTEDNHKDFSKQLRYKQRVTLPCNHNVVANGHRIDPGAKLKITVSYRFIGTKVRRSQSFNFRTVMGWSGQSYWQYDD